MALLIEETANQTESQQLISKVGFKINRGGQNVGRLITCPFDKLHFYLI